MKVFQFLTIALIATFFCSTQSCKQDPCCALPTGAYSNGVFIANQGKYPGPGEISFYNRDSAKITNDLFSKTNGGATPGSVIQSISFWNGLAYIVANNSQKIDIVNATDFKYVGSIDSSILSYPNYFLGIDANKAYISDWGKGAINGAVIVYDLVNKKKIKTIPIGKGADKMLRVNNKVYVTNTGGYDKDSIIGIIDVTTDAVTSLKVGVNSNSIAQDANADIWVLCAGTYTNTLPGSLVRIHNGAVDKNISIPQLSSNLTIDPSGKILYYIGGDSQLYTLDVNNPTTPTKFTVSGLTLISPEALGFDPITATLWVADAKDFSSNGSIYLIDATNKTIKNTYATGVAPGFFWF